MISIMMINHAEYRLADNFVAMQEIGGKYEIN